MTDAERLQERIDRALALHRPTPFHMGRHRCVRCKVDWPCETTRVLAPDAVWPACEECIRVEAASKARWVEAMAAARAAMIPAPVIEFQ